MTSSAFDASSQPPGLNDVLAYWLGATAPDNASALSRRTLWFTKSDATDADMRSRFASLVEQALAGQLDAWADSALGRLGLIVLLDQFTRNLFRGTPRSFAGDAQALQLALAGMAIGHDVHDSVPVVARIFCYLPLEHAEDKPLQQRSVQAFTDLANTPGQSDAVREFLAGTLDYALKHQEVVERFGRFPHRNPILGRQSSAAELEYLAQPGAGF